MNTKQFVILIVSISILLINLFFTILYTSAKKENFDEYKQINNFIYFIVTTSIFNDCDIRKNQYIKGISNLKDVISKKDIQNYKIIIVENNGFRNTYLDELGCEVYYTNNNSLSTKNKGNKELQDILDCINKYNINENDFIVKMTGRYILEDGSDIFEVLKNINNINYDCIIKYGSYLNPLNYKVEDCITGLIGMRCKYVKQIKFADQDTPIEHNWGKITYLIDDSKIHIVDKLGIHICPGNNDYFLV